MSADGIADNFRRGGFFHVDKTSLFYRLYLRDKARRFTYEVKHGIKHARCMGPAQHTDHAQGMKNAQGMGQAKGMGASKKCIELDIEKCRNLLERMLNGYVFNASVTVVGQLCKVNWCFCVSGNCYA